MTVTQSKGNPARLVWILTALGLGSGALMLILMTWGFLDVSADRAKRDELKEEVQGFIATFNEHVSRAPDELSAILAQEDPALGPTGQHDKVNNLIEKLKASAPYLDMLSADTQFALDGARFEAQMRKGHALREKALGHRNRHSQVVTDITARHEGVKSTLSELRETVERAEGPTRVENEEDFSNLLAGDGVYTQERLGELLERTELESALQEMKTELSDLALLSEHLTEEVEEGQLVYDKDKLILPFLEKMGSGIEQLRKHDGALVDDLTGLLSRYETQLFGEGYSIDHENQAIVVGEGGLFPVLQAHLALEEERGVLQDELKELGVQMIAFEQDIGREAEAYFSDLATLSEVDFMRVLEIIFLLGGIVSSIFLVIAFKIAKAVKQQVAAIEERNSDLTMSSKALKESEGKFRTLYESTTDAVMLLDETGFFDCNGATLEMFRCASLEEFCSYHPSDMSPATQPGGRDSETLANEQIERAMKEGSNRFEWVHRRSNGQEFPAEVLLNAMELGGKQVLQAVVRDITERKQAEDGLRKLSRVVEQSPISVVVTDMTGTIEYVNPTFTRVSGYSAEEAIGQNPRVLNSGVHPKEFFANLWSTILAGDVWRGEMCNRNKSRDLYWESASIAPILNEDGSVTSIIAVKEDITKRKETEVALLEAKCAAEAAARAKSDFLANMSHEIRTPMNGVIGMTGLLLDTNLDAEQRQFTETVMNSANALLTVINDILDFSKIEAGKLDLEVLAFDLRTTLEDMNDTLAMKAQDKGLEYTCLVEPDVPTCLLGDPGRLRQVLTNLVGNAVKFTSEGEIRIRVQLDEEKDDEITARFSVTDTGIGIPHDKLDALFEAFTQADASTTRRFGGTGLGLSISKQLTEMMGGEIGAESEEGKGSTFWFTAVFAKQTDAVYQEDLPLKDVRGKRVLVVDDNETNRLVVRQQLLSWGCRHAEAAGGLEALEMLRNALEEGDAFDVAILDMQMPVMDGETLGRKIKEDTALRYLPLVMMSSIGQRGDAARFKEAGFSVYLTKPVKQSQFYDCLASVMGMKSAQKDLHAAPLITKHSVEDRKRRGVRILLAEDNVTNQQVGLAILKKLGYRADCAGDGEEVIRALALIPYDLVLMDCQMPVMDGYEATAHIRNPESTVLNHDIPIVAMTAHAMKGDREQCLTAGMDDYVSKPVIPAELASAIERQLNRVEQHPALEVTGTGMVSGGAVTKRIRTGGNKPLFDEAVLHRRFEGDKEVIEAVLKVFIEDAPNQVEALKKAIEANDPEAARRHAHSLRGASANVGACTLQELSHQAEEAENLESITKVVAEMEPIIHKLSELLTQ